jgi:hypothetical protein
MLAELLAITDTDPVVCRRLMFGAVIGWKEGDVLSSIGCRPHAMVASLAASLGAGQAAPAQQFPQWL